MPTAISSPAPMGHQDTRWHTGDLAKPQRHSEGLGSLFGPRCDCPNPGGCSNAGSSSVLLHGSSECGVLQPSPGPLLQLLHRQHLPPAQLHHGADPLPPHHVWGSDDGHVCRQSKGCGLRGWGLIPKADGAALSPGPGCGLQAPAPAPPRGPTPAYL